MSNSLKTVSRRKKYADELAAQGKKYFEQEDITKVGKILSKFDFLGEPVTFNYAGSQSY